MLRLDIDIVIILISSNSILVKQHYLYDEFVGFHRIYLGFFFFFLKNRNAWNSPRTVGNTFSLENEQCKTRDVKIESF